jgi:hypothetical protein
LVSNADATAALSSSLQQQEQQLIATGAAAGYHYYCEWGFKQLASSADTLLPASSMLLFPANSSACGKQVQVANVCVMYSKTDV